MRNYDFVSLVPRPSRLSGHISYNCTIGSGYDIKTLLPIAECKLFRFRARSSTTQFILPNASLTRQNPWDIGLDPLQLAEIQTNF